MSDLIKLELSYQGQGCHIIIQPYCITQLSNYSVFTLPITTMLIGLSGRPGTAMFPQALASCRLWAGGEGDTPVSRVCGQFEEAFFSEGPHRLI